MARINLLPWREGLRSRRQREFLFILAGAVVLTVLAGAYSWLHINGLIEYQEKRNGFLRDEIAEVDKKLKSIKELDEIKARLIARMNVIQQLQSSRPQIVHLFDELVITLPDGVYLNRVTQKGKQVTLTGQAQSNARVSALMRNIEDSGWLAKPSLKVVQTQKRGATEAEPASFELVAVQKQPKEDEDTLSMSDDGGNKKAKGKKR
ncbi:MAG: PilN domain-containing protein [Chromatiales bacterium]|jgi:type IV pilus assembly protein PilN